MWKFGWKRKAGENVKKETTVAFEKISKDENEELENDDLDWLTLRLAPKRQIMSLEDKVAKSARLKNEGSILAESERYWEAIGKWDAALQLTPDDERLYEMKSQALLILCEVFPALHAAEKAIQINPTWWVGYQTLGRARLGMGEVKMAIRAFSKAVHLKPEEKELWEDDLQWACSLLEKQRLLDEEKVKTDEPESTVQITELDDEHVEKEDTKVQRYNSDNSEKFAYRNETTGQRTSTVKSVPKDYIRMRQK